MLARSRGIGLAVLLVVALTPACSSSGGDGPPGASPTADAATGVETGPAGSIATDAPAPTGATGATGAIAPDACSLLTQEEAKIALAGAVELVTDPFGEGVIEGDPADFASICVYRPAGSDADHLVAVAIAAPGAVTDAEFDDLVSGGIPLGGPGDEGYAVEDGVLFRSGDLVVAVRVSTGEGLATDRSLALELAGLVGSRLPEPAPDPSNPACSLLTEDLAEEILGIDLVFGSDAILDDQRSGCGFREEAGPTFVSLRMTRGADAAIEFDEAFRLASDEEGFRELEGIGDRAFIRVGGGSVDVIVLAGDAFLGTMTFSPDDDLVDETIDLATAITVSL